MIPTHRQDLPAYFTAAGFTGWGAEIGTYRGDFAAHILTQWPGSLHCVDPYVHQPDWTDILNHDAHGFEHVRADAEARLAPWINEGRCALHVQHSLEAFNAPWAKDLDFVYLDARHDYAHVLADLFAWWPAVRPGGFFGGHDYLDGFFAGVDFGVAQAVGTWMRETGLPHDRLTVIVDSPYPTWFVRKDA